MRNASGQPLGSTVFRKVPLGGCGWVTGTISFSADGVTKAVGCDTHGAYVKTTGDDEWRNMISADVLPAADLTFGYNHPYSDSSGCWEVAVAPSDSTRVFFAFDGWVFRYSTVARLATKCGLSRKSFLSNDPASRQWHNKFAVDPNNANVLMVGTMGEGVHVSTNGGTSFTDIGIAAGSLDSQGYAAPHLVACDPSSAQVGGIRQRWAVSRHGTGIYVSSTGPTGTYTLTTGGPTEVIELQFSSNGTLWATSSSFGNNIWKWTPGGGWVNLTNLPTWGLFIVAINPANPNHVVAMYPAAYLCQSMDAGATWTLLWSTNAPLPVGIRMRSKRIRWTDYQLVTEYGRVPLSNTMRFNPGAANELWATHGFGVAYSTPPSPTGTMLPWDWYDDSAGIDQLCCMHILTPPGGKPILSAGDLSTWRIDSLDRYINYPRATREGYQPPLIVQPAAQSDYAADNPLWIATLTHGGYDFNTINAPRVGYSTDGGKTFDRFPVDPPNKPYSLGGGCMAVGNAGNVIILWNADALPVYTKDGGNSWNNLPLPGLPSTGYKGFDWTGGSGWWSRRYVICYDKTGNAFYLYNIHADLQGIWKSTNGGDTWTRVWTGYFHASNYNTKLKAVPGHAGHLFLTAGNASNEPMWRSTDGGVNWSQIPHNVYDVFDVAFGKPAAGQAYPAIYFYSMIGSQRGLWRTDDNFATAPILLDDWIMNRLDFPTCLAGDPDVYGRVYVGMNGSGMLYGEYEYQLALTP